MPPVPEKAIPEKLAQAVLLFEDRYFYFHPGVNLVALARAVWQNISANQIKSGASTITMQVARLMEPKKRSYFNKVLEMFQALKMEICYSKEEILHFYLDHAPYGGNVIGFQAASLRYFQKLPDKLTWAEAAMLAVLPNAPGLMSPQKNPEKLKHKRNRLLKKLLVEKIIDKETCELAILEDIPDSVLPLPMDALHLTQEFKNNGRKGIVRTTLTSSIQEIVGRSIHYNTQIQRQQGIFNCAVLVSETQSGKIRAYFGSNDFWDSEHNGQVNGVLAPRSSGSLLKPFLYALSIDDGLIVPQTLMKDVPTYFSSFSPHNANEKYSGIVRAKEALVHSLNVPAVRLLNKYGLHSFYTFLQTAGVTTLFRTPDNYGLPLILGGSEVTLMDIAALYRGLALGGDFRKLQIEKADSVAQSNILMNPGSAWLTLEMLRNVQRPGVEFYWQRFAGQWPLAWKTGTSYGQKDAWAVGVNPQWTIAVWVGNLDGTGNRNLAGARSAGPLLFDIFNNLPKDTDQRWFVKPEDELRLLEICAETGFLFSENCEKSMLVEAPDNQRNVAICPYHKKKYVTQDERYEVCSLCWGDEKYKAKNYVHYTPDIVETLRKSGSLTTSLPRHKPSCPSLTTAQPLQIIYPHANARLWLPQDFGSVRQKLTLQAVHERKDAVLFWYLDNQYLGETRAFHTKAVSASPGWHNVEVIDESGYHAKQRFLVLERK